jgi:hypothetical protein
MRKLFVILSLLLMVCLQAAANSMTIAGLGEVDFGQNITATEKQDKNGNPIYSLQVKDGMVWRGAMLIPPKIIPNSDQLSKIGLVQILNKMVDEKFSTNKDFLAADKAKMLGQDSNGAAFVSYKNAISNGGVIMNMDLMLVSKTDGIAMIAFTCADSDAEYWRPIIQKVVLGIQK